MSLIEITLIIMVVALIVLVLAMVPALLAIKRTAASVGELAQMIQTELKPALHELAGVLVDLKTVGGGVAEHTDDVKRFMSALGETGDNLHTINRSVGVVTGVLNATSVWMTGAKVAGKYVFERYLNKRGGM